MFSIVLAPVFSSLQKPKATNDFADLKSMYFMKIRDSHNRLDKGNLKENVT